MSSAAAEVRRLETDNRKKLAKIQKSGGGGRPAEDTSLATYEEIRWFVLVSDFPGGVPLPPNTTDGEVTAVDVQGEGPYCRLFLW